MGIIEIVAIFIAFLGIAATTIIAWSSNSKTSIRKQERDTFNETIKGLCSENIQEQIGSAILLRRYLNKANYAGKQLEKFKRETLNVISSMLKREKCCVLQKTLADSLSYVISADGYDFQETNFQNACLKPNEECLIYDVLGGKKKKRKANESPETINVSVKKADFFASDFSYATVNHFNAQEAIFYTANLNQVTFRNCNLDGADFRSTNLKNARFIECSVKKAKFDNAFLQGTSFEKCEISGARFNSSKGEPILTSCTGDIESPKPSELKKEIFISCPGTISPKQDETLKHIINFLTGKGIRPVSINKENYRERGQVSEISKQISTCTGCISLGFQDMNVSEGTYREGTPQSKSIKGQSFVSPWINIELGMAIGLGLPIFLVQDVNIRGGLYDDNISDFHTTRYKMGEMDLAELDTLLDKWLRSFAS